MRYLSLFSGIEAATQAWHSLGWQCAAVSEIDPFACAVLAHRYPHVPNLGDITKITEAQVAALGRLDLIVFGSPCQDLSLAGKRKGLAGERSGLFFTAMRIIGWARKHCGLRWALWENVPGAFSSNGGADFAAVVEQLAGLTEQPAVPPKGWGNEGAAVGEEGMVEWSTLDAQWFGVAQRRRRVFAIADFGDWACRPPILLERQSVRGDSAPSREEGQAVAGCLAARTGGGGGLGTDFDLDGGLVAGLQRPVLNEPIFSGNAEGAQGLPFLTCSNLSKTVNNQTPLIAFDTTQITSPANRSNPRPGDPCHPLAAGAHAPAIAFDCKASGQNGFGVGDVASTMRSMGAAGSHQNGGGHLAVAQGWKVRRLTPLECERLQGMADDQTQVPHRGKPAADGPRYKALGNSMAVPVMKWIGQRVDFVHNFF